VAVEFNIDGQPYRFPDWASESTQQQLRDLLKELAKSQGVSEAQLQKILKAQEEALGELVDSNKEEKKNVDEKKKADKKILDKLDDMVEGLDEVRDATQEIKVEVPKSFRDKLADTLERDGEYLGGALLGAAGTVVKFGGVIGGALLTGAGFVGNKLMAAGDTVNSLVESGIGFNTTFSNMGMGVVEATGHLGALGLGFGEAAELMKRSSAVIATQGFKRFEESMQFAADMSEELAMSFDDSMNTFGEALSRRQRLLNVGNLDQGRLNAQIAKTSKVQTAYATALGVSVDTLQTFVDQLTTNNGLLTSSLLRFNDTIRSDVIAGVEVFASGLAAMGGQAGQDVATAFLEAGTAGAIGMSDAAVGFVTALPSLAGPMNQFTKAMQSGTLTQDQSNAMVQNLTKDLGNLSSTEKERIRLLARTGDQSAQTLANAIAQFEQSESKIKDINKALGTGFDMDTVQKGRNEFSKIMAQVSGGFENAFFSLFSDPKITKGLMDGVKDIMGVFWIGTDDVGKGAQNAGKMVKGLVDRALPVIKTMMEGLKDIATFLRDEFKEGGIGGVISALLGKAAGAIIKYLVLGIMGFAGALFAASAAKTAFAMYVLPQLQTFTTALFSKGSELAKKVGETALGFAKSIFDSKGGKATQAFMGKAAGFIKDKAGGISQKMQSSPIGQKVADKLKSFQSDGAKMTEKLQGSMTKGGSTGGFLKSIADGVAKFGDTKVVKGAASLTLLAGAVTLTAIGLKKFNDVDFMSVVTGTAAMAGLATLAQFLGKGSSAMIKGAAAIFILGTSVIPLATGLQIMKDVGIDTIGVLAAGLITLGVAAAAMGSFLPLMLMGAAAIAALGVAIIPFAIAANLLGGAIESISAGFTALADVPILDVAKNILGFGAAFTLMLPLLPGMMLTGVALSLMGVALMPFALGAALAARPTFELAIGMKELAGVNWANLLLAAPALLSLSAGLVALSAGGLISGLIDGLGSLFGAKSPFDKLAEIGQNAKWIVLMSKEMRRFDETLDTFEDSLVNIDGAAIGKQFSLIADGIYVLTEALNSINFGAIAKLALVNAVTPGAKATQEQPAQEGTQRARAGAEIPGPGSGNIQSKIITQRQQRRFDDLRRIGNSRREATAGMATANSNINPGVVPVVGNSSPALEGDVGTREDMANFVGPQQPKAKEAQQQDQAMNMSSNIAEMIKQQQETNRLIKKLTRTTGDLEL